MTAQTPLPSWVGSKPVTSVFSRKLTLGRAATRRLTVHSSRSRLHMSNGRPEGKRGAKPASVSHSKSSALSMGTAPASSSSSLRRGRVYRDHAPPYHERVQVPGLGDSLAELGSFGELVPLDNGHPLEALGQRPQDQETHHAAADDQRVYASARTRVCSDLHRVYIFSLFVSVG